MNSEMLTYEIYASDLTSVSTDDFAQWEQEFSPPTVEENDSELWEQQFEAAAATPEDRTSWVEDDADHTISEEGYSQRLSWRAGNIGHALDVIQTSIENEVDAAEWLELKKVVALVKAISDPYVKVDAVIELEAAGYEFVARIGINQEDFDKVANT